MTLPRGWSLKPLRDVVDFNPRHNRTLPDKTEVSFVPMPVVSTTGRDLLPHSTRSLGEVRKGYTHFRDGDVLFAKITPCMENGKAAVARNLVNGLGCGTTELHVMRPGPKLIPEWLYFYVWQKQFRQEAELNMTGTAGQLRVPLSFLEAQEIPIPASIEEQRHIAAKLDRITNRLDEVKARLATVPALIKRFRQSVLAAACSGRLTEDWRTTARPEPASILLQRILENRQNAHSKALNAAKKNRTRQPKKCSGLDGPIIDSDVLPAIPGTWVYCHLQNLGEFTRGRSKNRPRNDPKLYGGQYPFIQTGDIANSGGRITSHKQTYNEAGLAQSRLFPVGTLCITIAANIADTAILTYPACFPDSVVGLIPHEFFMVECARYFIATAQNDLETYAPATAQKNINMEILEAVAFPLPPLEEQAEIVRRVEDLMRQADAIEARYNKAMAFVDKLMPAILAKAFRGELA